MRVIKQRLLEMIPDFSVFLDVDGAASPHHMPCTPACGADVATRCACTDLEDIANLPGYIERTQTVLIFCSKGYFESKNCVIELRAAVTQHKPIIALVDPDASRGGLTRQQVHEQLRAAEGSYARWGFDANGPRGDELHAALFASEPIEWNRIGVRQALRPIGMHPRLPLACTQYHA